MSEDRGQKGRRQDKWSSSNYTNSDERLSDDEWEEIQKEETDVD